MIHFEVRKHVLMCLFCFCFTSLAINTVTLLGRVGSDPQLRGNETSPVVTFSMATHTNYK